MFSSALQIRQDIQWLLDTPNLIDQSEERALSRQFLEHCKLPEQINGYTGGRRIGFYYQWLWQQVLKQHATHKLVAEELQVFEGARTVGAIDFIVENSANEIEHWEVAVKFYLGFQKGWIGPNAKDTLAAKSKKMINQQLSLSSTPAFQRSYPDVTPTKHRLVMQGRLYTNPYLQGTELDMSGINPDCVSGYWCWSRQLDKDKHFYSLTRGQWMALPSPKILGRPVDLSTIKRAQHVLDEAGKPWFVVPDDWPQSV